MRQSLFADFPPVSTSDWEAKIEADLKGASYERALVWHVSESLRIAPYYRATHLQDLPHIEPENVVGVAHLRGTNTGAWAIEESVRLADEHGHDALETACAADVDGVILEGPAVAPEHDRVFNALQQAVSSGVRLSVHDAATAGAWGRAIGPLLQDDETLLAGCFSLGGLSLLAQGYDVSDSQIRSGIKQALSLHDLAPSLRTLHLDACPVGGSGGTLQQSIAVILSQLHAALKHARAEGVAAAESLPLVFATLSVEPSFFPSIAALRALRLLAAQVSTAWGVTADEQPPLYLSVRSSSYFAGLYDPHVNLLRTTTQAMAAVVGGANSLSLHPYSARSGADRDGTRWARNIQHLLRHESHLSHVLDPGAGSYYLEALTDALAREAWETFQSMEQQGGWEACVRSGWLGQQVQASHESRQEALRRRKTTLLGTNQYPRFGEDVRPETTPTRPDRVRVDLSPFGDGTTVRSNGSDLTADEAPLTRLPQALPQRFASAPFDALRKRTASFEAARGRPATVFLALLGPPAMATARAQFALNFFGCAGFNAEESAHFDAVSDAIREIQTRRPDIVVLCSSDAAYAELAPAFLTALNMTALNQEKLDAVPVLAGYPTDLVPALQEAGWKHFVHLRSDMLDTLQSLQDTLGMP